MKVAVLTSVYDGYDPVAEPKSQTVEADWLCVTDGKAEVPAPWRTVVEPRPHLTSRMAAKVARCRPDLYTDADVTVWVDGCARFPRHDSLQIMLDNLGAGQWAQFEHPDRKLIDEEARVSAGMRKYSGQPVVEQATWYRSQGFPDGWGLWATGCIVRRAGMHVAVVGDRWLVEMLRWSWQDQVSEPYVLWRSGVRPVTLPGDLWTNPMVSFDYANRGRDD